MLRIIDEFIPPAHPEIGVVVQGPEVAAFEGEFSGIVAEWHCVAVNMRALLETSELGEVFQVGPSWVADEKYGVVVGHPVNCPGPLKESSTVVTGGYCHRDRHAPPGPAHTRGLRGGPRLGREWFHRCHSVGADQRLTFLES